MPPTTKPLFNEPAPRQFVPNEEAIFNAICALPNDQLISSTILIKLGLFDKNATAEKQCERWGLPVELKTRIGKGTVCHIFKSFVLAALGYSKLVRLGLAVPTRFGDFSHPIFSDYSVEMTDSKPTFVTRTSLLAHLAKKTKPKRGPAPAPAPVPAPAPAPAPASDSDELILKAAEDLLEKMDSFFGGQKILWQEMQLIRKGQEAIMRAFEISPAAATPQQPRGAN